MKQALKFVMIILLICAQTEKGFSLTHTNSKDSGRLYCDQYSKDVATRKQNPGAYYYRIAICLFDYKPIYDEKSFIFITYLLYKSASYQYPLANYALGLIYDAKYKMGSSAFGVEGKPKDIYIAIASYRQAASFGSSWAQNSLGELYLDNANIHSDNKLDGDKKDVKLNQAIVELPNIDDAVYWLDLAAKNGNPAAQGTLADLYRQGIGVAQDYVLAYVWFNLSFASETAFNQAQYRGKFGSELLLEMQKQRDDVYAKLTDHQKEQAQILSKDYMKNYFHKPSDLDEACLALRSFIAAKGAIKLIKKLEYDYQHLNDKS